MRMIQTIRLTLGLAVATAWISGMHGVTAVGPRQVDCTVMEWNAGAARVAITPEDSVWMAGYGNRRRPAEDRNSELWAKALALEDAHGERAVLVTMDLLGMERSLSQSIVRRLQNQHGLRRDQIVLSFSHTHSGPVVGYNLRPIHYNRLDSVQQEKIRDYAAWLEDQIDNLVGAALAALSPARLSWGSGQATFAVNRRTNSEREVARLRATGRLKGPVDTDVPVLAIRDIEGRLQSVVFGYACHATVLSGMKWDGDYPGYAQSELESRYPGSVALFWAGCGADLNPLPRRSLDLARSYGHSLADAVGTVLSGLMHPIPAHLQTDYTEAPLPFADLSEAAYPYPLAQWRLGNEIDWVFLGGEVVVDYALRIKSARSGIRTWVTAFANDVMGYIPSARVQSEGGYEATASVSVYGLPAPWANTLESVIIGALFDGRSDELRLPRDGWRFRKDPDMIGYENLWHEPGFDDADWRDDIPIEASWQDHVERPYHGLAWYRRTIDIRNMPSWNRAFLYFEGVDEQAWVWVNGRFAGRHAHGHEGWDVPFRLEITDLLRTDGMQQIAVRVHNTTHAGGIWRPVRLQMYRQAKTACHRNAE